MSLFLFVFLSVCQSVSLSVCLSIYLSIVVDGSVCILLCISNMYLPIFPSLIIYLMKSINIQIHQWIYLSFPTPQTNPLVCFTDVHSLGRASGASSGGVVVSGGGSGSGSGGGSGGGGSGGGCGNRTEQVGHGAFQEWWNFHGMHECTISQTTHQTLVDRWMCRWSSDVERSKNGGW